MARPDRFYSWIENCTICADDANENTFRLEFRDQPDKMRQ